MNIHTQDILAQMAQAMEQLATPENEFEICLNLKRVKAAGVDLYRFEARWLHESKPYAVCGSAFQLKDMMAYGGTVLTDSLQRTVYAAKKKMKKPAALPPAREGLN